MLNYEQIGKYRRVKIYKTNDKDYPYTGNGIVWLFKTIEALQRYIDNVLDNGRMKVNERGSLVFTQLLH